MKTNPDYSKVSAAAEACGLSRIYPALQGFIQPAISIKLKREDSPSSFSEKSHLGGKPDLPIGFAWPQGKERPLAFLLQIDLLDVAALDFNRSLPDKGLLSFFYDTEEQPWGYDPQAQEGFRVLYFENIPGLQVQEAPGGAAEIPLCSLHFYPSLTLPNISSKDFEKVEKHIRFKDEERDGYDEFLVQMSELTYGNNRQHHLLGHSANLQADMQWQAELVSNGINCGDAEAYRSKQAEALAPGAFDWQLLLQLDSDDIADMTWGDDGMLYFWMRRQDLKQLKFEKAWMDLQCY